MTATTDTATVTLVSHAGSRGTKPYGPTEHTPINGALELVTWAIPDYYTAEPVFSTLVEFEDRLWLRQPLTQALNDVEVDGSTIRFDGSLPHDGGCQRPVMHFDTEHIYMPFSSGVPLLMVATERGQFGNSYQRAYLRFWELEGRHFPWAAVTGHVPDQNRRLPEGLPGREHQRALLTIFEFDQIPEAARAHLTVQVHDETAARRHLDPAVVLASEVEVRRGGAEVVQLRLLATAQKVAAVVESGQPPEHYRQPSSGTETVYDPFAVSTRAVDAYLAVSATHDLFTRPARDLA